MSGSKARALASNAWLKSRLAEAEKLLVDVAVMTEDGEIEQMIRDYFAGARATETVIVVEPLPAPDPRPLREDASALAEDGAQLGPRDFAGHDDEGRRAVGELLAHAEVEVPRCLQAQLGQRGALRVVQPRQAERVPAQGSRVVQVEEPHDVRAQRQPVGAQGRLDHLAPDAPLRDDGDVTDLAGEHCDGNMADRAAGCAYARANEVPHGLHAARHPRASTAPSR